MKEWTNSYHKKILTGSEARYGRFRLVVHHYMGCGDIWFTSCYGLFDVETMKSKKLSEAKCQAKGKLQVMLEEALRDMLRWNNS